MLSREVNRIINYKQKFKQHFINPLTSPGEGVTVFTYLYLSAGAPALGEAKGLIIDYF